MWSVKITHISDDEEPNTARVSFHYTHTDGRTVTKIERVHEPSSLMQIARDGLRERERQDAIAALIAMDPATIDLTPPEPTPEQIARNEYEMKRQRLIQARQDLELGLISQAEVDDLVTEAVSAKPTLEVKSK